MSNVKYTTQSSEESSTNLSNDLLTNSLPARSGLYRFLSAKRSRDPSHRKSVSFNDVPIVHEVPLYDAMRNANCPSYRSWTYVDATPTTTAVATTTTTVTTSTTMATVPSFYSSQVFSPLNSTNAAAQKLHVNRLSSTLYSSLSSNTTNSRIPDWAIRTKSLKAHSSVDDNMITDEQNNTWSTPVIVVHTPDEKSSKETTGKSHLQTSYSNPYITHAQPMQMSLLPSSTSLSNNACSDNTDVKKQANRTVIIPDTECHRTIPFAYEPMSDSTATYTSMISTNIISSNHTPNEQLNSAHARTARARSATLPTAGTHAAVRGTDAVSITPLRTTTVGTGSNTNMTPTRTLLRPTTIAFQCSHPSTAASNVTSMIASNSSNNTTSTSSTSAATINSNAVRQSSIPARFASSTTAMTNTHSRFSGLSHRTYSNSSLTTSTLKYTLTHPTSDSTLTSTVTPQTASTILKHSLPAHSRSRSANVLSHKRNMTSSGVLLDNHANGSTSISATSTAANLYATLKRNPNVRQNYGSYYMHRVLLPTTMN
jgi:hypothetical protein